MKQNLTQYVLIALLVVGAYLVGVYKTKVEFLENGAPAQVAQVAGEQAAPEEKSELTSEEWDKALGEGYAYSFGDENAPVVLVEYTDYQCPFCQRYVNDTYGKIKENYVDTGKVRYVVRDLPLPFHANAEGAAVAARCAASQGRYLEMHDKLFATQSEWEELADATKTFVGYAGELGMNTQTFASCMEDESVVDAVQADADLASELGATGTPTFAINGQLLVGAQPYVSFESLIDSLL